MRGRSGRFALVALAMAGVSAGCVVPSYHLPAGFSSSYQRQLYGMDPGPPPQDGGIAVIGTRPGIFYPETAFRDQPQIFVDSSPSVHGLAGSASPMVLGTDPLSPPPKVAQKPPDNF
jgi:hypothetical protein